MIDEKTQLSDTDFTKLRAIIHKNTGITIGDNRKKMLMGRLRGRLREIDTIDFKSYFARLASDAGEMQELINRVTTNKTYCYRTPRVWQHFSETAVTEFHAKKEKRAMRIWSAAASSGEEPYTIGVLLEDVRKSTLGFDYSILGSDVSQRVLDKADVGSYSDAAVASLRMEKPDIFNTYMRANDEGNFSVLPEIKSRIKFKLHNLNERLKNTRPFDVVFLRNVLIYFAQAEQEVILDHVYKLLEPGGYLYIGESETLTRLNTGFESVEPLVYRPKPTSGIAG